MTYLRKLIPAAVRLRIEVEMNRMFAKSSRVVEYPYVMSCLDLAKPGRVMVFGSFNDLAAIELASLGFEVTGFDLSGYAFRHPNFRLVEGDFLITSKVFPAESFDLAIAVSSVEHAGLNFYESPIAENGDFQVVERIEEMLKLEGRLLMTVPFGRAGIYPRRRPSYRKYDGKGLANLLREFNSFSMNLFEADRHGNWLPSDSVKLREQDDSDATTSVACINARKSA